ncbi:MAG: Protein SrpB [Chroococcopsis gigantea SAG 12.99]|jgi:putative Mg2+ transporter-C (MgtC) family protein|nr:MgtC/SapB family protein [Chlorogloea purpurea SAG 13.99]MDV2999189.1 Protein SrpB [Chroococcopsis gigantea SAG 12.99]
MIDYTFNLDKLAVILTKLTIATLIGAVIGRERYLERKPAGMRTHILVCLGSTMFVMLPFQAPSVITPSQVIQGVAQGIGFLGAGEILHESNAKQGEIRIRGLTSAATIWTTAALGVTVGAGFYPIAVIGTVFVFFTLKFLGKFES